MDMHEPVKASEPDQNRSDSGNAGAVAAVVVMTCISVCAVMFTVKLGLWLFA